MKHLTITLLLLASFTIGQLHAQRFNAKKIKSYTVWTVDGTAHYSKNGGEKMAIAPGMLLSNDASVSLADGASIQLANDSELVSLSGKGDYQLNSNLKENTSKHSAATKPFFDLLAASAMYSGAKMTASDDGSGYGDGGSKKSSDDGSGYGDGGSKKSSDDGSGYGTKGKKKASDDGSGYGSKKAIKAKKKTALSPLKTDAIYKNGEKVDKLLMKAAALDNADLNMHARKFYKKALTKKPNDPVASQMYLAFLKRSE